MTDEIGKQLRAVLSPTQDNGMPRSVWSSLEERLNEKPRWSLIDVGLAASAAITLVMFPEWLWLLVYQL